MKTLIVGTTRMDSPEKRALLQLWSNLLEYHSSDCDAVIIDSCSPMSVKDTLPRWRHKVISDVDYVPRNLGNRAIVSFEKDIGRLERGQGDGAGQAFCKGIEIAIAGNYDCVVNWETDCLMARPIMPIAKRVVAHNVAVAAPMDSLHWFLETQLMFMSVAWLKEIDYVKTYDWKRTDVQRNFHEVYMEQIAGDRLFSLPLRGLRNDLDKVTVNNLSLAFPRGIDYISHCRDFQVYRAFLARNGIQT